MEFQILEDLRYRYLQLDGRFFDISPLYASPVSVKTHFISVYESKAREHSISGVAQKYAFFKGGTCISRHRTHIKDFVVTFGGIERNSLPHITFL